MKITKFLILTTFVVAVLVVSTCKPGKLYNPGNPQTKEYYLTQILHCLLKDPWCPGSCSTVTCPAGYIEVPCNSAAGTTANFCVAKYEMKCAADATGAACSGPALAQSANMPWVNIDQPTAITECSNLGANYHLITNPEWMTIARNIENTASNWSGGSPGSGMLPRGHSDNTVDGTDCTGGPTNACAADTNDANGYFGTSNLLANGWGTGAEQRRTHKLSNGEVIWDFAGNVWDWNDWQVTPVNKADVSGACDPTVAWCEWTDVDIFPNNFMVPATWQATNAALDSTDGIGQYFAGTANPGAAIRGGFWNVGASSGVFALSLSSVPTNWGTNLGFRCAK